MLRLEFFPSLGLRIIRAISLHNVIIFYYLIISNFLLKFFFFTVLGIFFMRSLLGITLGSFFSNYRLFSASGYLLLGEPTFDVSISGAN